MIFMTHAAAAVATLNAAELLIAMVYRGASLEGQRYYSHHQISKARASIEGAGEQINSPGEE